MNVKEFVQRHPVVAYFGLVSPVFAPNLFLLGIVFGLFPGFFEEVGWTGFAYPKMRVKLGALGAGLLLGVMWGLWHAPVVDYLGLLLRMGCIGCRSFWPSSPS